ncbi:hypothetical protein [Verrucomicrobium sp. 3C]|uniref:hypothetical protein n=1 Tax=Verrucomicrobium sp. 3C TaxID=1134055 RepID=UPI0003A0F17C|nr:hypothetical protein [Verrucomicrobium sp. 3C]
MKRMILVIRIDKEVRDVLTRKVVRQVTSQCSFPNSAFCAEDDMDYAFRHCK